MGDGLCDAERRVMAIDEAAQHPGTIAYEAQQWRMVRDKVHEMDAIDRPGAKMADDDILPIVLGTLERVAREARRKALTSVQRTERALMVDCHTCGASVGDACTTGTGMDTRPHVKRYHLGTETKGPYEQRRQRKERAGSEPE